MQKLYNIFVKILIVDDEEPIRELISFNLKKEKFETLCTSNGIDALKYVRDEPPPDAIVLDLMLPDMSGLDICRILKNDSKTKNIPIIMVTAKSEDDDIVAGLELGADDYVTKPFSQKVLTARIRSVLRRCNNEKNKIPSEIIRVRDMTVDVKKHEVRVRDNNVEFSATEFAILSFFAENAGQVFSRRQIINAIKGDSYPVTERAVDVQVLGIRHKLEAAGALSMIETIRGVGYRMCEDN